MPEVIDWPRDFSPEVLVRVADHLDQGRLVAVPTDTVYTVLAHGLKPEAVASLRQLMGDASGLAVGLADPAEARDWLPLLDGLAARVARHSWPGPLTLGSRADTTSSLVHRLPAPVREAIVHEGFLPLRAVGHPLVGQIRRFLTAPVILGELPGLGTPADVQATVGDRIALLVQDGPTYFGQPSSIVRVDGKDWKMIRAGVISEDMIAELALCQVLFVCTGNTCRSPLAMALCRKLLADRLGCDIGQLRQHGFQVLSAGLAAIIGEEASPPALQIVQDMGGDLAEHRSQALTSDMLARADCLFTMTWSHLRLLQSLELDFGPTPQLLSPEGADVCDPIGAETEVYRQCAEQLLGYLQARLPELLEC